MIQQNTQVIRILLSVLGLNMKERNNPSAETSSVPFINSYHNSHFERSSFHVSKTAHIHWKIFFLDTLLFCSVCKNLGAYLENEKAAHSKIPIDFPVNS